MEMNVETLYYILDQCCNHIINLFYDPFIIIALFIFSSALFFRSISSRRKICNILLLCVYLLIVLYVTLISREVVIGNTANFCPFWSYRVTGEMRNNVFAECALNILLFIPVGALSYLNTKRLITSFATGVVLSCMIEILQFFSHRGFCETDDVIHNTLGTVVGIGICKLVVFIFHPSQNKKFKTKRNQI